MIGLNPWGGPIFTNLALKVRGVKNTTNTTMNMKGKTIETHTNMFPVTPAGLNHPPKSNQPTKKTKGRILVEKLDSKPNGRIEREKRPRLVELQAKD